MSISDDVDDGVLNHYLADLSKINLTNSVQCAKPSDDYRLIYGGFSVIRILSHFDF